eukprot:g73268.t1
MICSRPVGFFPLYCFQKQLSLPSSAILDAIFNRIRLDRSRLLEKCTRPQHHGHIGRANKVRYSNYLDNVKVLFMKVMRL